MEIIIKYKNNDIKLDTSTLKQIGAGCEGKVYSYNDIAIKVHNNNLIKTKLSYNLVKIFKNIDTKRILLPREAIFINDGNKIEYGGYTTKLVPNFKRKEKLRELSSEQIYKEIEILKNDIRILSENKICIDDLNVKDNLVFNDKLYFVDPGSYYIDNNNVFSENTKKLGYALYLCLFCLYNDYNYLIYELHNLEDVNLKDVNWKDINMLKKIYIESFNNDFLRENNNDYICSLIKILEKYGNFLNYKRKILHTYISNSNAKDDEIKLIKKMCL